jgi:hypothetical protein
MVLSSNHASRIKPPGEEQIAQPQVFVAGIRHLGQDRERVTNGAHQTTVNGIRLVASADSLRASGFGDCALTATIPACDADSLGNRPASISSASMAARTALPSATHGPEICPISGSNNLPTSFQPVVTAPIPDDHHIGSWFPIATLSVFARSATAHSRNTSGPQNPPHRRSAQLQAHDRVLCMDIGLTRG